MINENTFTVIDENGNEIEMEIVLTFDSEDNRHFVLFKDPEDDEVYAYQYDEAGNLEAVEDEKDLDMCAEVLNAFQDEDLIDDKEEA